MRTFFHDFLRLRRLPVTARYGASTLLVLVTFGVCLLFGDALHGNVLIVFFPAIIVCAMLFDRGNGLYAVGLGAILTAYFFIEPRYQFTIAHPGDLVGLVVFVICGGITAGLIETVHLTMSDLAEAHAELRRTHEDLARVHRDVQASERQKDVLLSELAHRTKNDLTLVSSLLQIQARGLNDAAARDILEATVERIRVLGNAHARLTRSANAVIVDARAFLAGLCDDLRAAFVGTRPVALLCEVESHALSQQHAVAVGLITNELVTNAIKHAFPGEQEGVVRVAFGRTGDELHLAVEDDGIGMPKDVREGSAGSMGQRLVRTLTLELHGRYECLPRNPGTLCAVRFPASETERAG